MKECTACHETKPLSQFNQNTAQPDQHHGWCKPCLATYNRQNRKKRSREIVDAAKNKPCKDCGETYDRIDMCFTYRDPTKRAFKIKPNSMKGVAMLLAEIAKTDLICRYCLIKRYGKRS